MRSTLAVQVLFGILLTITISSSYSFESNTRNEESNSPEVTKELGVNVQRDVPVKMRDGTVLRADVYQPDRGGPYPAIVVRTPYGKRTYSATYGFNSLVKAGYIVVSQDVRGRYASEGRFESLYRSETHDAEDGYDTVEWAARLPRSTGKVGALGVSYDAFLVWRMAPLNPPSLVAMSANSIPAQLWYGSRPCTVRPAFRVNWWESLAYDMRLREGLPGVHTKYEFETLWSKQGGDKWVNWMPWAELPKDVFGYETDVALSWLRDPHHDPWKLDKGCKNVKVPNLNIVGWYDFANGDFLLYRTMVKEAQTEAARKGSKLIVGPWPHSTYYRKYGNIDFGPDAAVEHPGVASIRIRWFDYWLKGKQNGVDENLPVRIFVMGDNAWRDEACWPLERATNKVLFISSGGNANTPDGDGKLVMKSREVAGTDNYVYDPADPVPTPYRSRRTMVSDRRPLADRKDILVYQTEPLTERLEATGNPVVELYASTSAPDTDWFVWLIDVAPDGLSRDVSSGVVRARYRNGFGKPELITPGQIVKYTIRMDPTSNAFLPGHKIRLDVTSSDFPNFDRNHNTAANPNVDDTLTVARQVVHHGANHATRIILPCIPDVTRQAPSAEGLYSEPVAEEDIGLLHEAAADGDIRRVKQLLCTGGDINAEDRHGNTPLYQAVVHGKMQVMRMLIEAGADVNAGSESSLHAAVSVDDKDAAEYLLARGANPNHNTGWPPLRVVPISDSLEMLELLLSHGANDDGVDTKIWHRAIKKERADMLDMLLKHGMDINKEDGNGMSPLAFAAIKKKVDMIGYLLAHGALINQHNTLYGFTALHYAARFGKRGAVKILIEKGADIHAQDRWSYQPIHWAAYHDQSNVVRLLIAKGADVHAKTSLGQTPWQIARERKNTETIEALGKNGAIE